MAATEKELGELHLAVTRLLTAKATGALEDVNKTFDPGTADSPAVIPRQMSPAEMSVAVALLKNNSITCKRNVGSALDELDAILKQSSNAKPTDADLQAAMAAMEFTQAH